MPKALLASLSVLALASIACLVGRPAPGARKRPEPHDAARVAMTGELVSVSSAISHPRVLAGERREVYLHVGLRAAELPDAPRLGMNLALVIDRSGSMASEDKLRFAKSAAEQLVSRLRPDDRLAIVAYDDEIRTVVPSTPAGEQSVFLAAIRALEPGGSTDLHGGMVRGYEQVLEHFDAKLVNGVVLLSDGLANAGVHDSTAIVERAGDCHERGVRISTMGMGVDYDEALLGGIAQHAGGNYYYVGDAESVGGYLDQELDELGRVVARDLEVRVELGEGVELHDVFGHTHSRDGRVVTIPLRDMYGAQRCKVVLRLGVAGAAGERRTLAETSLRYVDAVTREPHVEAMPALEVAFTDSAEEVQHARDAGVLVQAEIVQDAVALETAMKLQKEGRFEAAHELLAARYLNSRTLNETEYRNAEVERILQRMMQVMQDLERTRSDPRARRDLQLATELRALGYMGN